MPMSRNRCCWDLLGVLQLTQRLFHQPARAWDPLAQNSPNACFTSAVHKPDLVETKLVNHASSCAQRMRERACPRMQLGSRCILSPFHCRLTSRY